MNSDRFIVSIKTEHIYKDIANDIEKRFDTSNYKVERSLIIGKNKKSNRVNKRRIRRKDYDRVCRTYAKNVFLLNSWLYRKKKSKGTK